MPLYEYRCDSCGGVFETIQKFSDAPLSTHENCGGRVERLISVSTFQLKGSGWYATDYAKGSAKPGSNGGSKKDAEAKSPEKKDAPAASSSGPEKK